MSEVPPKQDVPKNSITSEPTGSSAKAPLKDTSKEVTGGPNQTGILDSAKQYIPTTQGIGETAKKYVPESVAAYLPGSTPAKAFSLPSTETPSGSAGGVGSLPGRLSEVSVAKLPEERRQEGLPSHETDHERLGKTGGVGPLPGGPNESGVALLPEERAHSEDEILRSSSGGANAPVITPTNTLATPQPQPSSAPTQVSPAGIGHETVPSEKVTQTTPGAQQPVPPKSTTEKAKEEAQEVKSKVASKLSGHSGPTGAKDTSATSASSPPAAAAPAAATGTAQPSTEHQPSGHRASTGSAGTHHKVGFMDKMKGEAKIISGKLGKNEKKVEEGRHLMGKA